MSYVIEIDKCSKEQWADYCLEFKDYSLYQTWAYQECRAKASGQSILRVVVKDEFSNRVLLAQFRVKQVSILGIKIAYAQWGPLIAQKDEVMVDVEILSLLKSSLHIHGIDVIRVAPNIIDDERNMLVKESILEAGFKFVNFEKPYRTFMVDVSDNEAEVRKRLRKSFRRDLKKAESVGVTVKVDTDKTSFEILSNFYLDSKERKGFKGLSIEEFVEPQEKLQDVKKMKIFTAYLNDKPVASLLSTEIGRNSIVLLAASSEEGFACGASYLLWYKACVSACENGFDFCDLGGIDPDKNPNVYKFKSRLGGEDQSHIGTYEAYRTGFSRLLFKTICAIRSRLR